MGSSTCGEGEERSVKRGRILRWDGPTPPLIPHLNYAHSMIKRMTTHGHTVALVESETGKQWTFSELCELVPRVSGGLAECGVGLGDRVLCLTPIHIDYTLVLLAIIYRGATCVPINPTLNAEELAHVLRVSEARWAVVHEACVSLAEAAFTYLPSTTLRKMWVMGESPTPDKPSLHDLFSHDPIPPLTTTDGLVPDKMAAIMPFSSGTTGPSKGVLFSHRTLHVPNMTHLFLEQLQPEKAKMTKEIYSRALLLLPVAHSYGHIMLVNNLFVGTTTVCLTKFTPTAFLETIQKYQITVCPLVPHLVKFLSDTPLLKEYNITSVKAVMSGAAPIDTDTINNFEKKTGIPLTRAYGMTETYNAVTRTRPPPDDNPTTVGKVTPYTEVKVINDGGELVCEGEEGELCVRGPGMMLGYANNQTATSATLDSEGWIHTGDIGYYDQQDFLYITDRRKDIIKVKAYPVSPHELEEIVKQYEGVSDVAVVGVKHQRLGEAPKAFVVLKPNAKVTAFQIQSHVEDRVASYKQLAGGVKFVDVIPRNPTGKILKKQLKECDLDPEFSV
ncbi:hypothetical protein Pcinc_011393 [Petrolisthes cinctipes]|uniref:4-coumarate--CoA ligase n=1 Tax=Petrolisthes cinctipes TaxID=88211 RepID=A0AAE1G6Y2_PETCI|nr:hypothetical protein Pcinc_011393 [Petrolisthes cinctipes]